MEKSGLLISARNIYHLQSSMAFIDLKRVKFMHKSFNFTKLPQSASQLFVDEFKPPKRRNLNHSILSTRCITSSSAGITIPLNIQLPSSIFLEPNNTDGVSQFHKSVNISNIVDRLVLIDLDPATAKIAIGLLGPFLSAFSFLFILRIVMSWYPKLPVEKFPYVLAYAPTEPILGPTRKLIPPLAGVDVTPVVWFGLISFLSEILVGPQGLLVLLSKQV